MLRGSDMTRRGFLLSAASFLAASGTAFAASHEEEVAARLQSDGFRITRRKRTWLGRVKFDASKGQLQREVVLDPSSGEILRDYTMEPTESRLHSTNVRKGGNDGPSSGGGTGGGGEPGGESGGGTGSGETGGETGGKTEGRSETGGTKEGGDVKR